MKLIAITGGPGAGKTAILEMARQRLCKHILIVPEAAEILYRGGFWRQATDAGRIAAQLSIYHVQRQMEWLASKNPDARVALCDRGTMDCLAYWPESSATFFSETRTSVAEELARYDLVIHLRTPNATTGYNSSSIRIETADEASSLDEKLLTVWNGHHNRVELRSTQDFMKKMNTALQEIQKFIPACECSGRLS